MLSNRYRVIDQEQSWFSGAGSGGKEITSIYSYTTQATRIRAGGNLSWLLEENLILLTNVLCLISERCV